MTCADGSTRRTSTMIRLQSYCHRFVSLSSSPVTKRKATGARVWWKDYVCPKKVGQPVKRKCTPAKATVKRVRK